MSCCVICYLQTEAAVKYWVTVVDYLHARDAPDTGYQILYVSMAGLLLRVTYVTKTIMLMASI